MRESENACVVCPFLHRTQSKVPSSELGVARLTPTQPSRPRPRLVHGAVRDVELETCQHVPRTACEEPSLVEARKHAAGVLRDACSCCSGCRNEPVDVALRRLGFWCPGVTNKKQESVTKVPTRVRIPTKIAATCTIVFEPGLMLVVPVPENLPESKRRAENDE